MAALSDQFLAVDVLFSHGISDLAEEAYAQILKHAVEMDDKPLEVVALKAIGDVYLDKGRISKDGKDFTKASALYNAALVRCADWDGRQSLVHRIKRTEKCFLRYVVGIRNAVASTRKEDIGRKLQLGKIRCRCKEKLQTLSSHKYHSYEYEDNPMESEEARNAERRRTEAVRSMYHYVAVKMKHFIADIVDECIKTLGTVSCQYAMVGMGSICKEEMTPYSDLEFAILVEEGKCTDENKIYFRTLTHLLHLKVLNVGETILPSMTIKSLNDFKNKENDWYYDNTTPHGFSFDGSMPWASKTALGRDPTSAKPALELIMTPSEMAELQKDERSVKEGYHLADVLCNVTLISDTISRLSAALGDFRTVVQYLEKELQLEREYNRQKEMTTRYLLWQSYTELSMPEEAEKHRLAWINCLHPLLSEAVIMLQDRISFDDVQRHTLEDGLQRFEEAVHADKFVIPWDIAVYVLNYSVLLENQRRHTEVNWLLETALDKLEQCEVENDFDTKEYPRMVVLQVACLFYMRQGNVEKSLGCLQTVLKCSTYIHNDHNVNMYIDQASMNQIGFLTVVLNLQHSIGYSEEVKMNVLADIDRICSTILFRAQTFGPELVQTCTDCLYAYGMILENIGETLAAVEMFHVGLKICTSHIPSARALVFLAAMFRARRLL
uniref:Protein-PII uridylyltransferase N-terminal domain-containing protein n=1 Tax=Branchiostoma floridae TaxID=7739 RepID=C3XRG0_BRAFL|eukprot:XP_002613269.1 hypothetical protein BRAFLDRAFT_68234 [Branchiostoma floridae]